MRSAPHRSNKILIPSLDLEFCLRKICGGKGIRTPDLLIANETLYQLSYTPEIGEIITSIAIFIKHCPVCRPFFENRGIKMAACGSY